MAFHIQFNKMKNLEGLGDGLKWQARVTDESGKLKQSIFFEDKNGDGNFSDDEIFKVINYDGDKAIVYEDTDGDKVYDSVSTHKYNGNKDGMPGALIKQEQESENLQFNKPAEQRVLSDMNQGIPDDGRPVVIDKKNRQYKVQLNADAVAIYQDKVPVGKSEGDGYLAPEEATQVDSFDDKGRWIHSERRQDGKTHQTVYHPYADGSYDVSDPLQTTDAGVTSKTLGQIIEEEKKK